MKPWLTHKRYGAYSDFFRRQVILLILLIAEEVCVFHFNAVKHLAIRLNLIQNVTHIAFHNDQLAIRKVKQVKQPTEL